MNSMNLGKAYQNTMINVNNNLINNYNNQLNKKKHLTNLNFINF